jgi:TonB family protein
VNPKNILVTRKATVYLLDVDSFQVTAEGRTYRCEGGFPEYTPPELQGVAFRDVDRAQGHDCFGLAVVIFQLLFLGRHPYSGQYLGAGEMSLERAIREFRFAYGEDAESREMRQPPGTLALDSVPPTLVDLFRRAFLSTDRPGAREWIERLDELAKALKKCDDHSGHYYYRELSDCPWCGIETQASVRLFNFLFSGGDSRRGHFRLDEIWKEIVRVKMPDSSLIRWDEIFGAPEPSAEVMAYSRARLDRFIMSLIFATAIGLLIPLNIEFPLALFLLILAGLVACAIGQSGWTTRAQALFHRRQPAHHDPLPEQVQERWRQAEEEWGRIQSRYEREAGNERWKTHWHALQNQKETYENLAQIRRFKLNELEAEVRKNQLGEFLDQFKINDANLKGIGPSLKTALFSHGVETAADLIDDVTLIPSVGRMRAKWLLEWRRDLEKKFVFDPSKGLPSEARIKIERDVDALRFRLETELSGGAHYLHRLKQEIETSQEKLRPSLMNARQKLTQAEKDLKVARKRYSSGWIITALMIAFFFGLANHPRPAVTGVGPAPVNHSSENSGSPPPPPVVPGPGEGGNMGSGDMNIGGGRSIEPMTSSLKPTILYSEKPKYTEEARQNKIQGTVVLQVVFNVNGTISDVNVTRGLPDGLTEKAIEAARKIRFNPAVKAGTPVSVRGSLEFTFNPY